MDVLISIPWGLVIGLLLWLLTYGLWYLFVVRRTRRIWGLRGYQKVHVALATGTIEEFTGILQTMPQSEHGGWELTAEGQFYAIAPVVEGLAAAWPTFDPGQSMFSKLRHTLTYDFRISVVPSRLLVAALRKNNLVLLGGPKRNVIAKEYFDQCNLPLKLKVDGNVEELGKEPIKRPTDPNKDLALITRLPNKDNQGSVVIILAGSKTYGTRAAAEYMRVENYSNLVLKRHDLVQVLLDVTVNEDKSTLSKALRVYGITPKVSDRTDFSSESIL